jgi:hypothetical protein
MRTNLAIRPSVKVSATNWFGPSGWARIATGVHASLPRTTAFAGTTAGDIQTDRATCIPGKWYVYSLSVRFVSASNDVETSTHWYTGDSTFLRSDDGNVYNQAGGTTKRVVSGVVQAPADASTIRPNLFGIDASAQCTALLIEQYDTEADALAALPNHSDPAYYFDGDGNGVGSTSGGTYAWTGTDGASTSTFTFSVSPVLSGLLPAPVGHIVTQREALGFVLSGELPAPLGAIGLFVTIRYDETRGRVRVNASGMTPDVVRVVVSSRRLGTSRWAEVRGGRVGVTAGAMVRTVDDYEFIAGEGVEYRIQALTSVEGQPDVVVQTRTGRIEETRDEVWIKFIATPYRNKRVVLTNWSRVARKSRVALYDVNGKPQPTAVTDVHTGRQFSVDIVTHNLADRDALDAALGTGVPIFFQAPTSVACPSMYAVIGDYDYGRPGKSQRSLRSVFTVQLIEISAPPPSVVGLGLTYGVLRTLYGSYGDLRDAVATYADLNG